MSRIVSVWLKAWPIARLLRAQACVSPADAVDSHRPLVLVAPGKGGARIVALNRAAQQGGLVAGDLLSNARSKLIGLQARDAEPAADADALRKLALWCLRYTPVVAPWDDACGADGLFLDITGCAHLFGGEEALLGDLARRLRGFGLVPRSAIADTIGAAWAIARYGQEASQIVPPGGQKHALDKLPLAALRLPPETQSLMHRLGFRHIGEVRHQPRAPFAARFDAAFLTRLDQALGHAPEPLTPVVPPPVFRAQAMFVEPIISQEHVLVAVERLLDALTPALADAAKGARRLRLLLFRVVSSTSLPHDGGVCMLDIGLAAPNRDPAHIARLIALRLDRLGAGLQADFGFEAAALHVLSAEPLPERQVGFAMEEDRATPAGLAQLVDTLEQRLGRGSVQGLHPYQSHLPERAIRCAAPVPADPGADAKLGIPNTWETAPSPVASRPLLLLPRPETAEVIALIPEGPPRQFRWRGVLHQVADAIGPERIAPEWWRRAGETTTRDYYLVEDSHGRRFWLYRAGLYGSDEAIPQWFMHGVFG